VVFVLQRGRGKGKEGPAPAVLGWVPPGVRAAARPEFFFGSLSASVPPSGSPTD
jgi:hypothetical protein